MYFDNAAIIKGYVYVQEYQKDYSRMDNVDCILCTPRVASITHLKKIQGISGPIRLLRYTTARQIH